MTKSNGSPGYCPVCGYDTIPNIGKYNLCDICYWEDDSIQRDNPDSDVGANNTSLTQARKTYREVGACESRLTGYTRKPTASDERDSEWPYDDLRV